MTGTKIKRKFGEMSKKKYHTEMLLCRETSVRAMPSFGTHINQLTVPIFFLLHREKMKRNVNAEKRLSSLLVQSAEYVCLMNDT